VPLSDRTDDSKAVQRIGLSGAESQRRRVENVGEATGWRRRCCGASGGNCCGVGHPILAKPRAQWRERERPERSPGSKVG
jgi:hypothetical protein